MKVTVQMEYNTNTGEFKVAATANKQIRRDILYTMLGRLQETLMAQAMEERFKLREGQTPTRPPKGSGPGSGLVLVPGGSVPPHPSER